MYLSTPKTLLKCFSLRLCSTVSYQLSTIKIKETKLTSRVKRPPLTWVGVPTGEMCLQIGISTDTLKDLRVRGLLPKGIYWYTLPGSDRIIWVRDLVRDYMVNGGSPAHQRAVEKYLVSLPSSCEYRPTSAS